MPAVRLRALSEFRADLQAETLLLPLHRLGCVSSSVWSGLHQSADPPRLSGPVRVARNHSCSRRAGVDSGRDSTSPGSGAEIRSRTQTGAEPASGTDTSRGQYGALADRIPRGPLDARRVAETDAGVAQATTGDTIGTDLHGTGRFGSVPISAAHAHADGVPPAPSREVRNHGDARTTENSAAPGQGNSRGDRHYYRPAFASDPGTGTAERRSC